MATMRVTVDPKNGTMDEAGHIISRPCVTYRPLYRARCLPDAEWQRVYLEALRYKWRYHVWDTRGMQAMNRIAWKYVPWVIGMYAGLRLGRFL